jgi:hypothetical protein
MTKTDGADIGIWVGAKLAGTGAEGLGAGVELHVAFDADYRLVFILKMYPVRKKRAVGGERSRLVGYKPYHTVLRRHIVLLLAFDSHQHGGSRGWLLDLCGPVPGPR